MRARSRVAWLGVAVLLAACSLWRGLEAASGDIPELRAAGEIGALWSVALFLLALAVGARRRGAAGLVALALLVPAFGGGVVAPLWRAAHPPAPLFELSLGGVTRDQLAPPVSRTGQYRVEVTPGREGGLFLLHVDVGERRLLVDARDGSAPESFTLNLREGEQVRLYLEFLGDAVSVRARPEPLPWSWVRLAALVAVLLAAAAEALAGEARARGLMLMAVGAAAIFVSLLDPEAGPSGRAAAAYAMGAVVAAGVASAAFAAALNRMAPRGRRRA